MITALPSPPSTNDPSNFATKADALLAALPGFVTEANATAVAMNLNSTTDTSASSVAIGTGAKSFTVSTGKSFQSGMWLVIADTAAPSTNQMYGTVTSYDTGTGALVMNIVSVRGSGTKTAWVISQSAPGGAAVGANSDITSLTGLTTPLSRPQGGTGVAANVVLVDRAYAAYTTNTGLSSTIPIDDSIPQVGEGSQILSVSITPKSVTSRVRLRFQGTFTVAGSTQGFVTALFSTASSDALAAQFLTTPGSNLIFPSVIEFEHVPGSVATQTYSIRVGAQTDPTYANGISTGRYGGGSQAVTLIAEELAL